jgi:hypothetical protein
MVGLLHLMKYHVDRTLFLKKNNMIPLRATMIKDETAGGILI